MGGTSTDVFLYNNQPTRTTEGEIAALPLRLPMFDIHTVGAGGGSTVWLDPGGALRVGPQSAGASPGPACYGQQSRPYQPTVTDAHLVLGHLSSEFPLGDGLRLHRECAYEALAPLAQATQRSIDDLALGILQIAESAMTRAIQKISVQRGHDPRDFVLLPFGGAGGLHACRLAEGLGIRRVLLPPNPGLLSAFGMLSSAPLYHFSQSILQRLPLDATNTVLTQLPSLQQALQSLHAKAECTLNDEGIPEEKRLYRASLDLRYEGQSYEINVAYPGHPLDEFEEKHHQLYGYTANQAMEIVHVRYQASAPTPPLQFPSQNSPHRTTPEAATNTSSSFSPDSFSPKPVEKRSVYVGKETWGSWSVVERSRLSTGDMMKGPLLLHEPSCTTLLPPHWQLEADALGQLHLQDTSNPQRSGR